MFRPPVGVRTKSTSGFVTILEARKNGAAAVLAEMRVRRDHPGVAQHALWALAELMAAEVARQLADEGAPPSHRIPSPPAQLHPPGPTGRLALSARARRAQAARAGWTRRSRTCSLRRWTRCGRTGRTRRSRRTGSAFCR